MEKQRGWVDAPHGQDNAPNNHVLFELGRIVATPEALRALEGAGLTPDALLARHRRGDWGDLDEHDKQENERALDGARLVSAYDLPNGKTSYGRTVWIITEDDRSVTTLLLPDEY